MMANRKNFKQTQLGQIPEAWEIISLGQICNIETGNTDTKDAVEDGRYPLFDRSQEVKRSDKYLFDCAAVIVPGEGKDFTPTFYDGKFDLHQRAYAIWSEEEYINPKYLYYAISTFKKQLSRWAVGSTVRSLRMGIIEQFQIPFPPVKEQEKIADVLSSLDDKIELNRKMNQTLEEMGKALFKHWFVDFEFPCLPENYKFSGAGKPPDMESVCTYKSVGGLPVPQSGKWFVYVLLCKDESFYIGITNDLYYRWYQHKTGQRAKWTKVNEPVKVIHYEEFSSKEEAAKREKELKTGYGRKWLKREYAKLKGGLPAHKCKLMQAGEMVESELGEIPKSWRVGMFKDIVKLTMGLSPKSKYYNTQEVGLPLLNGASDFDGDNITPKKFTSQPTRIAKTGDIVFCIRATIGNISIADREYCLGRGVAALEPEKDYYNYTLFGLKRAIEMLTSKASGSVIKGLSKDDILTNKIVLPSKNTLVLFEIISNQMLQKAISNKSNIKILIKIRDLLLPRLMSGHLRI